MFVVECWLIVGTCGHHTTLTKSAIYHPASFLAIATTLSIPTPFSPIPTHTHVCTHAHTHTHTHARTHARTHTHTHTHTYTHTHSQWPNIDVFHENHQKLAKISHYLFFQVICTGAHKMAKYCSAIKLIYLKGLTAS